MIQSLYVAWRAGDADHGRWGTVGRLDRVGSDYRFVYTRGAQQMEGFSPMPGMPDLYGVYESENLLPFFANRLLARSRPEYDAFLEWSGFDPINPPDPISMLGVTEGRRETDSFELFPAPVQDASGCYVSMFFLHGVGWMPPAALERIAALHAGERLGLMLDVLNPYDRRAVAVRTCDSRDRFLIGYVPRYLALDFGRLCSTCDPDMVTLSVRRTNPDAPLEQRVLCRLDATWPEDFQPCSSTEYQPIADLDPLVPRYTTPAA